MVVSHSVHTRYQTPVLCKSIHCSELLSLLSSFCVLSYFPLSSFVYSYTFKYYWQSPVLRNDGRKLVTQGFITQWTVCNAIVNLFPDERKLNDISLRWCFCIYLFIYLFVHLLIVDVRRS